METAPPPVPLQDAMEIDHQKRKRALTSEDERSPKRRRSPLPEHDIDADGSDDATPSQQKNIRRMQGSRNLSNMNLRHAAERQKTTTTAAKKSRKSRFVEGSLTDKSSTKPPSMFMRFIRTDSGNIKQVMLAEEDLMEDYHNDQAGPLVFVDKAIAQEKADLPGRVAQIEAEKEYKSESGAFGKWASSLHPVSLWNKVFAQAREEMIREDFEEAERKAQEEAARKAQEKADVEARYHEMKAAGMFKPKYLGPVTGPTTGSVSSRTTAIRAPRDSRIVIDDESSAKDSQDSQPLYQMSSILNESGEHHRSTSQISGVLATPQDDITSASDAPETASKPAKTLKSRLHLKKPSLTNIQGSLKRAKSEWSLAQTLHHRESSSSISPVKADFENSALKKSQSKHELKKQNKLSKRVSDLESKLSQARKELDEALVEASPMPKLGSRYERFTPQSTLKRPQFVPGKLPSLPSERILMAQQQEEEEENKESHVNVKEDEVMDDAKAIDNIDPKESLAEAQVMRSLNNTTEDSDDEGEETIKARAPNHRRQYPTRASSLFTLNNNTNIGQSSTEPTEPIEPTKSIRASGLFGLNNNNIEQPATETTEPVEPAEPPRASSLFTFTNNNIEQQPGAAAEPTEPAQPTSVSEELPQTSLLTELTSSQIDEMDPNSITDFTTNDAVDQVTNPPDYAALDTKLKALDANVKKAAKAKKPSSKTKKRKSGANEMDREYKPVKGTEEDTSDLGEDRTPKKKRKSILGFSSSSPNTKKAKKTSPPKKGAKKTEVEVYSDASVSPRGSFESARGRSLEVVPEEADEDEMDQRTVAVDSAAEEQMITRAAEAAKSNRSAEAVRIIPGEMGVPALPGGVIRGEKEGKKAGIEQGEDFEWPPDVF